MKRLSKKSEAGIAMVLIVVVIVFFLGWLVNISQKECRTNKDCGSEAYCGSDFSCHEYPVIQKTVVQYNFLLPSLIIGLAIVIAAAIIKWSIVPKKEQVYEPAPEEKAPAEVEEITEPYYSSDAKIKAP